MFLVQEDISLLVDACDGDPCGTNGACVLDDGGFHCNCNEGYVGEQCDRG